MATLYATQSDGTLIPVQADSQGRLVAELAGVDQSVVGDLLVTGDVRMSSLNGGGALGGFRNLIINGDFRICQRGTTHTAQPDAGYFSIDRWRVSGQTTLDQRGQSPAGFTWNGRVRRASGTRQIMQGIELEPGATRTYPDGAVYTLSYWSDQALDTVLARFATSMGGAAIGTITTDAPIAGEVRDGYTHYSHKVTIGATDNTPTMIYLMFQHSADFLITGVQFEFGPIATPFEHRHIGIELALCQRYYIQPLLQTGNGVIVETGAAGSGIFSLPLPVEMRAVPTLVGNFSTYATAPGSAGEVLTVNSVAIQPGGVVLFFTPLSSNTRLRACSSFPALDAEL